MRTWLGPKHIDSMISRMTNRRWKRIFIVLTSVVWLPIGLLIATVCMVASMIWEGEIGDLLRWIWKGKAENV
jgi:hypothetical protein